VPPGQIKTEALCNARAVEAEISANGPAGPEMANDRLLPVDRGADVSYFEGSMPLLLAVPLGGGQAMLTGESPLDLVSALRERMRLSVGAQPHIVVCRLDPSVIDVSASRL
jgi:hypothetical protein